MVNIKKKTNIELKKQWQVNEKQIITIIKYYYGLGWRYKSICVLLNINDLKTIKGKYWTESNLTTFVLKTLNLPKRFIRRSDFNEANNTTETQRIDANTINKILDTFFRV